MGSHMDSDMELDIRFTLEGCRFRASSSNASFPIIFRAMLKHQDPMKALKLERGDVPVHGVELVSEVESEMDPEMESDMDSIICLDMGVLATDLEKNSDLGSDTDWDVDSDMDADKDSDMSSDMYSKMLPDMTSEADPDMDVDIDAGMSLDMDSDMQLDMVSEMS